MIIKPLEYVAVIFNDDFSSATGICEPLSCFVYFFKTLVLYNKVNAKYFHKPFHKEHSLFSMTDKKSSHFDLECHSLTFRCPSDEWFIYTGQTRLSSGIRCMACQIWKMTKEMVAERKPSDKNMTTIYSIEHQRLTPTKGLLLLTPLTQPISLQ